jgi:hypothetical protein
MHDLSDKGLETYNRACAQAEREVFAATRNLSILERHEKWLCRTPELAKEWHETVAKARVCLAEAEASLRYLYSIEESI